MPLFCGRKATSLTSFLFIYLLLIAIVRRLAVAEIHIIMEEKELSAYDSLREAVEKCDTKFAESSEIAFCYCRAIKAYKRYLNEDLNNVEKKEILEDILKKLEDCAKCFKEGDLPLGDLIFSHISEIKKELEQLDKN